MLVGLFLEILHFTSHDGELFESQGESGGVKYEGLQEGDEAPSGSLGLQRTGCFFRCSASEEQNVGGVPS